MFGPADRPHRLIPQIVLKSLKNEDILLSSWDKKRDFIFVEDIVEAFVKALEHKDKGSFILNLGAGKSYSLKQIAQTIIRLTGSRSKLLPNRLPDRTDEASNWLMDVSSAKKILGWEPKTSLVHGLKKTVEYFQKIS